MVKRTRAASADIWHHRKKWVILHRRTPSGQTRDGPTPFGSPSSPSCSANWTGFVLPFSRAWTGTVNPSEINYRANIYALKSLGVRRVISVSAVGSMKESIKPGDVVLPDQFIDLTKRRVSTFFEGGLCPCGVWRSGLRLARHGIVGCGRRSAPPSSGRRYSVSKARSFRPKGSPAVSPVGCECDRDDESP